MMTRQIRSACRLSRKHRTNSIAAASACLLLAAAGVSRAAQYTCNWTGGSLGSWNNIDNWSLGWVPTNSGGSTYDVSISSGQVTVDMWPTIDRLTLGSNVILDIAEAQGLTIAGGGNAGVIDLDGVIRFHGGANWANLRIGGGSLTLNGAGSLDLSGSTHNNWIRGATNSAILNNNVLIQGAGGIGINSMFLNNSGTISSTVAGDYLVFDPTDGAGNFNRGVMRADGGELRLYHGTLDNTGGIIEARNSSVVNIWDFTVNNGTLTTSTGGVVRAIGTSRFADVTNTGAFELPDNNTADVVGTFTNTGSLSLQSAGNYSDLRISGDTTFTGNGVITLGGGWNNRLFSAAADDRLFNQSRIEGGGRIGENLMLLTNSGTISANLNGLTLQINPRDTSACYNASLLRATNGGRLQLYDGTLDNTGGTIRAEDASTVEINAFSVTGGDLTTTGSGVVQLVNGSTVRDLNNSGLLRVPDNNIAYFSGSINNNGTLSLEAGGNYADFRVTGASAQLTGSGVLRMNASYNNRIFGVAAANVLNNQITITGAGQIGVNSMWLDNSGAILASQNGAILRFDPTGNSTNHNTGLLRAANGGILELYGGSLDNTTGRIEADAGSSVRLTNFTVSNGTLATSGDGVINAWAAGTLADVNNLGWFNVPDNCTATLIGTINNSGSIQLNAAGNLSDLWFSGGSVSLTGGGSVLTTSSWNNRLLGSANTTLLNNQITISGAGQVGVNQTILNNTGVISSTFAGATMRIDPTDGHVNINSGTMRAVNGAVLELYTGTFDNTLGVIEALDTSRVDVSNSTVNGLLQSSGSGYLRGINSTFDNITLNGRLDIPDNATSYFTGTLTNGGSVTLSSAGNGSDLRIIGAATFSSGGAVSMSDNFGNRIFGNSTGVETLNNQGIIQGGGRIGENRTVMINTGTIIANAANTILRIDPSDGTISTNAGVIRADGNVLELYSGSMTSAAGIIEARDGSRVDLNAFTLYDATLHATASGYFRAYNSSYLTNPTIQGQLALIDGQTAFMSGAVNGGSITLNAAGNGCDLRIIGSLTLGGGAQMQLSNNAANRVFGNSTSSEMLYNPSVIQGSGQIGVNQTRLSNTGTISSSHPGGWLYLDFTDGPGSNNSGLIQAAAGANLQVQNSSLDNSGGTIRAMDGATVNLSALTLTGGQLVTQGGGTIVAYNNTNLSDLTNNASLFAAENHTLILLNTIANNGTITINSLGGGGTDLRISAGVNVTGAGTIAFTDTTAARIVGNGGVLTSSNWIVGAGQFCVNTMSLTNTGTILGGRGTMLYLDPLDTIPIHNTGLIRAVNAGIQFYNGSLDSVAGAIEVAAGSKIVVNYADIAAGAISVDGTIYTTGSAVAAGPIDGSGALVIASGSTVSADRVRLASVDLSSTSTLSILTNGSSPASSRVNIIAIDGTSRWDLDDNDLIVGTTPLTTVRSLIVQARAGGAWTGRGLTSSAARNNASHGTTLGVLSGTEYAAVSGAGTFSGLTYVGTDTLVKHTWYGDTDFNGVVNFDDYTRIDQGFNLGRTGWLNGDFDYSGVVGFDDYSLIDLAFNTQTGTLARAISFLSGDDTSANGMDAPSLWLIERHLNDFGTAYANVFLAAVPEPTALAITTLGLLPLVGRRARKRR